MRGHRSTAAYLKRQRDRKAVLTQRPAKQLPPALVEKILDRHGR